MTEADEIARWAEANDAYERVVEERDKYKREADTLAETLRITQARCTELGEELRAERNKAPFKRTDEGDNDGRPYGYHPTNCLCAVCCVPPPR